MLTVINNIHQSRIYIVLSIMIKLIHISYNFIYRLFNKNNDDHILDYSPI